MSGESARRLPPRVVPIGAVALAGVLYAVASLLGWGGSGLPAWTEVAAAAAATVALFAAVRPVPPPALRAA
ncbi:MAG TPA: hypothetical protein VHJ17_06165, partial [Thermomonospora sp.]|nr:hypothetical protein [Thermomonospora sp.]